MRNLIKEFLAINNEDDRFEFELDHESEIAEMNEEIAEENGFDEIGIGIWNDGDKILDLNTALAVTYYKNANDENCIPKIIGWYELEEFLA